MNFTYLGYGNDVQSYNTAVPNLGYVKNLEGYTSSRITLRFSMKQLTNANRKRLGTADLIHSFQPGFP